MDSSPVQLVRDPKSQVPVHQSWNGGTSTVTPQCTAQTIQTAPLAEEAAGDEALNQYTLEEVRDHWDRKSCWIVLFDFVYDVTEFLQEHPGGAEILLEHAGYDSTLAFKGKGHSDKAHKMLEKYCIGQLVKSERIYSS